VTTGQLQRIVMKDFPLDLYAKASAWAEALMREFAFIVESGRREDDGDVRQLLAHVDAVRSRFVGFTSNVQRVVDDAIARGETKIDLELDVTPGLGEATVEIGRMLDEADAFCRSGALLTVAAPEPIRAFRSWYTKEFERQLAGGPFTAWPGPGH
jgi:hypothetical protein